MYAVAGGGQWVRGQNRPKGKELGFLGRDGVDRRQNGEGGVGSQW